MNLDFFKYCVSTVVCSGVLYVLYRWLVSKKSSYSFCCRYLLAAMLFSIVVPMLNVPLYTYHYDSRFYNYKNEELISDVLITDGTSVETDASTESVAAVQHEASAVLGAESGLPIVENQIKWQKIPVYLYLAGLTICVGQIIFSVVSVMLMRRRSSLCKEKDYVLAENEMVRSPFTFMRTIFVCHSCSDNEWKQILSHERSHVRHRHSLQKLFMSLIRSVLWFNPFVWCAEKSLDEVQEWQADHDALSDGYDLENYRETVIRHILGLNYVGVSGINNSLTKKRILKMDEQESVGHNMSVAIAAMLTSIGLFFCFGCVAKDVDDEKISGDPNSIIVVGKIAGFEENTTLGSADSNLPIPSGMYNVTFIVEEVVSGKYDSEEISFTMKSIGTLSGWPHVGNHFMCMLKASDSGYSLNAMKVLEVYEETGGKFVAGRVSKNGYYEDTFKDYARKVTLPESESISRDFVMENFNRGVLLDGIMGDAEDYYSFSENTATPIVGVDVEHIAEYWLSENVQKDESNRPVTIRSRANHKAVDLGLSVKWADCNLGAANPSEQGAFFAWGETEQKSSYTPANYKWCDSERNLITKYYTESEPSATRPVIPGQNVTAVEFYDPILPTSGMVDDKTMLDPSDDAVRKNWGNEWRMPTSAELKELVDNCDWERTVRDGVGGYLVKSRINGNSIFLPFTGFYSVNGKVGDSYNKTHYGLYMSSTLARHREESVNLRFSAQSVNLSSSQRSDGLVIRPVRE